MCNHNCKSSSKASYLQVQLVVHSLVTVFTSPHYTGKSYCLQTLSPLKTAVLANTLFCSLTQLNILYAGLHIEISNYWINLDQFNVMLLYKYKQKEQLKMNKSSKKVHLWITNKQILVRYLSLVTIVHKLLLNIAISVPTFSTQLQTLSYTQTIIKQMLRVLEEHYTF